MKKTLQLICIAIIASLTIYSCKPEPILQPVLDEHDRVLLEHIKKLALEGDSILKIAKELPGNSMSTLTKETRIQYAQIYFDQAKKILENVQKKRNIADEIFAMKLKMYNMRTSAKDTIIPEICKPCYQKLNYIESKLEYSISIDYLPSSLKEYESEYSEECKCMMEK
jgi:hypothetical protein